MECSCAIAGHFSDDHARSELEDYRRKGPLPSTSRIADMLKAGGLEHASLLDIGGGIGSLACELADKLHHITLIDLSPSNVAASRKLAAEKGYEDRLDTICGDFTRIALETAEADVVVLDRVVCCYPFYRELIQGSADKARDWYVISYPHDRFYMKADTAFRNWRRGRRGSTFRTFVHPPSVMRRLISTEGFRLEGTRRTLMWQIDAFRRVPGREAVL